MGSLKGDARINQRVGKVRNQHPQQSEGRTDEQHRHDRVVVAEIDALEQERPHARDAKDHLDDDRAADEARQQAGPKRARRWKRSSAIAGRATARWTGKPASR